jgi:membrane protein implicated in regulation of membrane protease activity
MKLDWCLHAVKTADAGLLPRDPTFTNIPSPGVVRAGTHMIWTWWMWLILGLLLLVAEMLTPGFFLVFFGAGALVVGTLSGVGAGGPLWLQVVLFSGISIVSLLLLRSRLVALMGKKGGGVGDLDALVGEIAAPIAEIAPGATGKAEFRGTSWTARNAGGDALRAGQRCKIDRVEGLTIWLRAE